MINDIVQEILVRLPVKSLARCMSLSEEWKEFISHNKSLRQKYLKRNQGVELMFGFYVAKHIGYYNPGSELPDKVHFLPTSNQGRTRNKLKKRKRDDNDDDDSLQMDKPLKKTKIALRLDDSLSFLSPNLEDIRVLGTSNGFLLCTLDKELCPMSYLVCNPINKRWFSLPRANLTSRLYTHGFICHSTSPELDTADYYKVVRAIAPADGTVEETLSIEIISSDVQEWKQVKLSCSSPFILDDSNPMTIVISDTGEFYIRGRLLKPETQTLESGVIIFHEQSKEGEQWMDFPPAVGDGWNMGCFGLSEGHILYSRHKIGQIKVWMLNKNENSSREWLLKHQVSLEKQSTKTSPEFYTSLWDAEFLTSPWAAQLLTSPWDWQLCFVGFHPKNMNILFLGICTTIFLFDMESSTIEKICRFPEQGWKLDYYLFPYTYGLIGPHLFSSD